MSFQNHFQCRKRYAWFTATYVCVMLWLFLFFVCLFTYFVESMKWLGIKACLLSFQIVLLGMNTGSDMATSPEWIHCPFKILPKCPEEISIMWCILKRSASCRAVCMCSFGHQPSSTERVQCSICCLAGRIIENNWELKVHLETNEWSGRLCLPCNISGEMFPEMERMQFSLPYVCMPACLPACRVIVCVCEGICILFSKTEIHILAYCPWAQTGTLFSIELYPFSDLFWNLDLFVKYSNIGAKTTFGMLLYSHGNVVCGCSHYSEWKWLPGAFLPLVWILQNYTQLLQCAVLLCCYKMGFDWKCNPENGFKISCFFWYVLEPPSFLHLVFTTLMRRKIQTDFFFQLRCSFALLDLIIIWLAWKREHWNQNNCGKNITCNLESHWENGPNLFP